MMMSSLLLLLLPFFREFGIWQLCSNLNCLHKELSVLGICFLLFTRPVYFHFIKHDGWIWVIFFLFVLVGVFFVYVYGLGGKLGPHCHRLPLDWADCCSFNVRGHYLVCYIVYLHISMWYIFGSFIVWFSWSNTPQLMWSFEEKGFLCMDFINGGLLLFCSIVSFGR